MSSVTRNLVGMVAALWAATIAVPVATRADPAPVGPFVVRPPEMTIPAGTKPGALRRIIQPFGSWTLLCDENLKTRTRVCNVSQTLVDTAGRTVFSWSLAASQNGAPVLIIRLPAAFAGNHFAQLVFHGPKKPREVGVILDICDATVCLGYLEVDASMKREISAQAKTEIKVLIGSHLNIFTTSLEGVNAAVSSLK